MKLKNFWMVKDTLIQTEQQTTGQENIFTNYTSYRRLTAKLDKELKERTSGKQRTLFKMVCRSKQYSQKRKHK